MRGLALDAAVEFLGVVDMELGHDGMPVHLSSSFGGRDTARMMLCVSVGRPSLEAMLSYSSIQRRLLPVRSSLISRSPLQQRLASLTQMGPDLADVYGKLLYA